MPTLKLTGGGKSPTRTAPKRKPAAKQAPTRKPAASKRAAKPAAAPASTNGAATRGPKLPDGWSQRDFNQAVKDMAKARAARENAEAKLKEAQEVANGMALELLQEGVQMSVISTELVLSRQWLYTLMEKNGITPAGARKPARGRSASTGKTSKPAAKKRPAAKAKPAAKKAPARKRPASKPAPAARGRVRIAR